MISTAVFFSTMSHFSEHSVISESVYFAGISFVSSLGPLVYLVLLLQRSQFKRGIIFRKCYLLQESYANNFVMDYIYGTFADISNLLQSELNYMM